MLEHGGGGSSTAGPIVAKVYEALFGPIPGIEAAKAKAEAEAAAHEEED